MKAIRWSGVLILLTLTSLAMPGVTRAGSLDFISETNRYRVTWNLSSELGPGDKIFSLNFYEITGSPGNLLGREPSIIKTFHPRGAAIDVKVVPNFMAQGNDAVLLVTHGGGSGGFSDWEIIAKTGGTFRSIFKKNDVQGLIKVNANKVEEWDANRCTRFAWKQGRVQQICSSAEVPVTGPVTIIKFSMDAQKNIRLRGEGFSPLVIAKGIKVTLKVGEKISLVNEGKPTDAYRVMFSGDEVIRLVEEGNTNWIARKRGSATISIIPDGYDWNRKKIIEVSVE
jgi:hypothetical protein